MVQTVFEFHEKKYKLKYQKTDTDGGELYQGMIFSQKIIGFTFLKAHDKSILFDNEFIDKEYQDMIVEVIEQAEQRAKHK